ncbi:hypothetical protein F5148DRAFT_1172823 [Russula earlei]|uniref:Uncharacterized protein n=1 Tax=Russula earlei TaxID=71964 RepID=A0ACC0UJF4_9AGAM|nr:hypothetical protein F5148DRAFT_1172823 [Russula earlei]
MKKSYPSSYAKIPSDGASSTPPTFRVDKSVISPPLPDSHLARIHSNEFSEYLAVHLERERSDQTNPRRNARQKLTRLTGHQFHELCTDVYDELVRRKSNSDTNQVPFLHFQKGFHPKRNQARQKLSTLATSRFQDLSSDVLWEIGRRFPECKGEPSSGSLHDNFPSFGIPNTPPERFSPFGGSTSENPPSGGALVAETTRTVM